MSTPSDLRALPPNQASLLQPGTGHYRAFVGPPSQYDFMGATQFRLLTALGLREHHTVLDFGCGSLRAGRLLIPYLLPDRYFGLDPNYWLIEDGIDTELGRDIIRIKRPTFRHDADFRAGHFQTTFDFIVAQSIFSHAGRDLIAIALQDFRNCLKPNGLALVTFIPPDQLGGAAEFLGDGWIYPDCVAYQTDTVLRFIANCGLVGCELPWFHPRQTWFALAHETQYLPQEKDFPDLSGKIVRGPAITF